ncbi:MAG: RNA 2',3'-cyclic phosphodiesterase [Nitrosopumilus sp.]|nr:RNA 2',3'-cyclic phosphodiesterase [Nitrosopumilus sp.]MDH3515679.1 RNA 2',3'-cyclic phosphodiesterase [Nitrosopumilus sp.]MDH5554142.1 RNA 2',3'-cyclic phosphodiesterase [Nitrosopumilus sp.]
MRTFVAIEITNNEIINSVKKFQDSIKIDAKPVESNNFHFTLQFLGEITEEVSKKIIKALNLIEFTSFSVNLKGVGVFPRPEFPRIIWIGTDENGGNMLIELSKKVEKVLKPLGFSSNKAFKPHITVFRIKKKIGNITNELKNRKMVDFGIQEIVSIKLKKSKLTSKGPIYLDLVEINAK